MAPPGLFSAVRALQPCQVHKANFITSQEVNFLFWEEGRKGNRKERGSLCLALTYNVVQRTLRRLPKRTQTHRNLKDLLAAFKAMER